MNPALPSLAFCCQQRHLRNRCHQRHQAQAQAHSLSRRHPCLPKNTYATDSLQLCSGRAPPFQFNDVRFVPILVLHHHRHVDTASAFDRCEQRQGRCRPSRIIPQTHPCQGRCHPPSRSRLATQGRWHLAFLHLATAGSSHAAPATWSVTRKTS